jgi:hypothetical protein
MPDADMAEAVEYALIGHHAVGKRELIAGFVEGMGHWKSFFGMCQPFSVVPAQAGHDATSARGDTASPARAGDARNRFC